ASDITMGNLLVLPQDLEVYGYNSDQFSVARAVRMSCSIPFFFDAVRLLHKPPSRRCYVGDGAILGRLAVCIFDKENPKGPTVGVRLFAGSSNQPVHEMEGPFSVFYSMFLTMMDAHDNRHIRDQDQVRKIMVATLGVKLTDFAIIRK